MKKCYLKDEALNKLKPVTVRSGLESEQEGKGWTYSDDEGPVGMTTAVMIV